MQRAAGVPLDALAKQHKVGRSAIHRHWVNHVDDKARATYLLGPTDLEQLHARAAAEGESVLDYYKIVRNALMASMADARELGDPRAVATVAGALIACLDKLGRITGEIATLASGNTTINMQIVNSPEFIRIQQAQLTALAPFPDALAATVAAWRALDGEDAARTLPAPLPAPRHRAPITIDAAPLPPPPPAPPDEANATPPPAPRDVWTLPPPRPAAPLPSPPIGEARAR